MFVKPKNKVLENKSRKKIYQIIKKLPGIHYSEILKISDMKNGQLIFHLQKLEKEKLVVKKNDAGFTRYFLNVQTNGKEEFELIPYLRNSQTKKIILVLLENKKINHNDLAKKLEITPSTLNYHMKKLESNNIIKKVKIKNKICYSLDEDKREEIKKILSKQQNNLLNEIIENYMGLWE